MAWRDQRLRDLFWICAATAAWAFGFGTGSQLASHWMNDRGASHELIGWGHAFYYLGLALGSISAPWAARGLGRYAPVLGMLVCGPTLAAFPFVTEPYGWLVLRFLNGAAGALGLIPLEARVSRDAPSGERARNFAFYGVALTLGGAVGIWTALNLYDWQPLVPFWLGSAAPIAGGLMLLGCLPRAPNDEPVKALPVRLVGRRQFLSFGTAWSQGFLEGGMIAFLALYLEGRGLTADLAGDLMGVTTIGVIIFQVPVSWLADRCGRMPVLLGCYGVVLAGLGLAPLCPDARSLASCLFLFGACAGAMYPLGLAMLGEDVPEPSLATVYSWYLAVECVGSLMGPPVMGMAIDAWGGAAMFGVGMVAVALVLLIARLIRTGSRRAKSSENEPDSRAA
jgi:MFS family permease